LSACDKRRTMSSRDARTDLILNKYGLCSYTPPEVHHYSFKKISFVRPERHISSYVRRTGQYDIDSVNVNRLAKANYIAFGPVDAYRTGIYETKAARTSGSSSSSSYTRTSRDYSAELLAETPDYRTRYSGNTVHSLYSYSHAPRDYDLDKWYMKKSRSEYVYTPSESGSVTDQTANNSYEMYELSNVYDNATVYDSNVVERSLEA